MSAASSQFEWKEFLRLAKELRERNSDEAAFRSAISRAYYAAFKTAYDYLNDNDVPIYVNRTGTHELVWEAFQEAKAKVFKGALPDAVKKIGEDGDRLKRQRHAADYDSYVKNLYPAEIDKALARSESILAALAALPRIRA